MLSYASVSELCTVFEITPVRRTIASRNAICPTCSKKCLTNVQPKFVVFGNEAFDTEGTGH